MINTALLPRLVMSRTAPSNQMGPSGSDGLASLRNAVTTALSKARVFPRAHFVSDNSERESEGCKQEERGQRADFSSAQVDSPGPRPPAGAPYAGE